jgi:hypothetical protein
MKKLLLDPQEIISILQEGERIPLEDCDSPIEDMFLWDFRKVADKQIRVRRQQECQTRAGAFRLDFLLYSVAGGPQIGIECDGRDFHSVSRDSQRDAAIVAAGVVQKIYRLRGCDIHFRIHDTLHLLSLREPWLFSERGRQNLDTRSAPACFRQDTWGTMTSGFPYGIMRSYELDRSQLPDDGEDYEEEDLGPRFPTFICWTESVA